MAKKTVILIGSIIVMVCFSELIIRFVFPQNLSGSWRVVNEHGLLVNKDRGVSQQQVGERIVSYAFYPHHFRDTKIGNEKHTILVLGDSFTFGWLLDKADTYVAHLQKFTDDVYGIGTFQYVNAAAGGWGTSDYVAFVEDEGEAIAPDMILVFINVIDIERSLASGLYRVEDNGCHALTRCEVPVPFFKKVVNSIPGYQWFLEHSHALQLVRKAGAQVLTKIQRGKRKREDSINHGDVLCNDAVVIGKALFLRLNEWCARHGVTLVVTTTGWHENNNPHCQGKATDAFMKQSDMYFDEIGVPFFDITPYVSTEMHGREHAYVIEEDMHPNEAGSRLIANAAWQYFVKDELGSYLKGKNQ